MGRLTSPPGPIDTTLPLVGRSAELNQLTELLQRVAAGRGQVALIEGEAGIGKSRLMEEARKHAASTGFLVLSGQTEDLVSRPLGPFLDALSIRSDSVDPDRREIARVLEPGGQAAPTTSESSVNLGFRVTEALTRILEKMAMKSPTLLILEDIHWAEESTLSAFVYLSRRMADLPLGIAATLRPSPRSNDLTKLMDSLIKRGAEHLLLGSLSEDAVSRLVVEVAGAAPGPSLAEQIMGAAGNPLFVIEVLRSLDDEGLIEIANDRAETSAAPLSPSLSLTILRRLSLLPEETSDALRSASVLGSSFSIGSLTAVTGRTAHDLMRALKDAFQSGILGENGDRLMFRHDLIRQAIYEDIPGPVRKALHHDAGLALAAAGADAIEVAGHLRLGASPGDAEAIEWLRTAASEAYLISAPAAVDFLKDALALLQPGDSRQDELKSLLVLPMLWSGETEEAMAVAHELLSRSHDPSLDFELRRGLAGGLEVRGDLAGALAEAERTAELPRPADRSDPRPHVAYLRFLLGDLEGAAAVAQDSLRRGTDSRDPASASSALIVLALVQGARGHSSRALDLAAQATAIEKTNPQPSVSHHVFNGLVLTDSDRFEDAKKAIAEGRLEAEKQGHATQIPYFHWMLAGIHFFSSELDDVVAEAQAGLSFSEEIGPLPGSLAAHAFLARVAMNRNDLAASESSLIEADEFAASQGAGFGIDWVMWARSLLLETKGATDPAFSLLSACWDLMDPLRYFLSWRTFAPDLVRMAITLGDLERARSVTETAEEGARRSALPTARGAALRCRGLLENNSDILLASVDAYRRGPRPMDLAQACEDSGSALGRSGDKEKARVFLDEAISIYERVDAPRDAGRAAALLRNFGLRRGSRKTRSRPSVGWESLTPSELKVVKLTAEGLTNSEIGTRLFISRYTVETHLKHVFAKLGVSSRVEVAAQAAQRLGSTGASQIAFADPERM